MYSISFASRLVYRRLSECVLVFVHAMYSERNKGIECISTVELGDTHTNTPNPYIHAQQIEFAIIFCCCKGSAQAVERSAE